MKNLLHNLFSDEINADPFDSKLSPEDEIDALFMQLEQFTPPASLVEDILSSVAHLPLPRITPEAEESAEKENPWSAFEGLIAPNTSLQPS